LAIFSQKKKNPFELVASHFQISQQCEIWHKKKPALVGGKGTLCNMKSNYEKNECLLFTILRPFGTRESIE